MANEVFGDDFDDEAEQQNRRPAGNSGGKRLLLLIVLPLLLLGGIGAGLYFSGMLDGLMGATSGPAKEQIQAKTSAATGAAAGAAAKAGSSSAEPAPGGDGQIPVAPEFLQLPDMLVNLQSNTRRPAFMKVRLSLELANAQDRAMVEARIPRILDNVQTFMREMRPEQLQGSAGLYRLREELKTRVNQAVAPAQVQNVLFQELLVQ